MLRCFVVLIPLSLLACSADRPAPVAPTGKVVAVAGSLSAPTNLKAEVLTDTSVWLYWDRVEGATDYDVNYKRLPSGKWKNKPHRGTKLQSVIYGLLPNTEYKWAVRAENKDGASDWTFGEGFTTLDPIGLRLDDVYENGKKIIDYFQIRVKYQYRISTDYKNHFTAQQREAIREAADQVASVNNEGHRG